MHSWQKYSIPNAWSDEKLNFAAEGDMVLLHMRTWETHLCRAHNTAYEGKGADEYSDYQPQITLGSFKTGTLSSMGLVVTCSFTSVQTSNANKHSVINNDMQQHEHKPHYVNFLITVQLKTHLPIHSYTWWSQIYFSQGMKQWCSDGVEKVVNYSEHHAKRASTTPQKLIRLWIALCLMCSHQDFPKHCFGTLHKRKRHKK